MDSSLTPTVRLAQSLKMAIAATPSVETAIICDVGSDVKIIGGDNLPVTLPNIYPLLTPAAGDAVQVIRQGNAARIIGALSAPRHPGVTGIINSVSGSTVTVLTDVGVLTAAVQAGYSPAVGDIAACTWSPWPNAAGQWTGTVSGKVAAAPPGSSTSSSGGNADQGSPTPVITSGTEILRPLEAGTWQAGWRTDTSDIVQGFYTYQPCHGWLYYDTRPSAVSGTTITGADIFLATVPGIYQGTRSARLVTHSATRMGASEPAYASVASISLSAGAADWFPLSLSVGQAFADGAAKGVGVVSNVPTDWIRFRTPIAGREKRHPDSFAIRLRWRR